MTAYDDIPFAFDDEQCPVRQEGLNHILDGEGHCAECFIALKRAIREPKFEKGPITQFFRPRLRIPRAFNEEYMRRIRAGLSEEDAQAQMAEERGLRPAGTRPWTLGELARLQFTAWRTRRIDP
jgi:hypothetical protein